MKKGRSHDAGFKVRVALEAVKGERRVSGVMTQRLERQSSRSCEDQPC